MAIPDFPIVPLTQKLEPLHSGDEGGHEPANARGNKQLADEHLEKGRVHQAITRYKKAARMGNDPVHRTELGDAYAFAELPVKAVQQYKKALKAAPGRPEPHFSLAEVYTRYGRWQLAASEYALAVELRSDDAFYRYKLANALIKAGCAKDAMEHMEAAVRLHARNAFYRFELASLYADVHRDYESIDEMEQAVDLSPDDDYYISRLGMLYTRVGEYERAADRYREAIRLSPRKLAYHCLLADVYLCLGFETRAELQFAEAKDIDDFETDFVARARRFVQGESW